VGPFRSFGSPLLFPVGSSLNMVLSVLLVAVLARVAMMLMDMDNCFALFRSISLGFALFCSVSLGFARFRSVFALSRSPSRSRSLSRAP
jgi:hypothetical protein